MSTRRRAKQNWPRYVSRSVVAGPLVMSPGKGAPRVGWAWSRRCARAAGRANRGLRMPEKDSRPLFFRDPLSFAQWLGHKCIFMLELLDSVQPYVALWGVEYCGAACYA